MKIVRVEQSNILLCFDALAWFVRGPKKFNWKKAHTQELFYLIYVVFHHLNNTGKVREQDRLPLPNFYSSS